MTLSSPHILLSPYVNLARLISRVRGLPKGVAHTTSPSGVCTTCVRGRTARCPDDGVPGALACAGSVASPPVGSSSMGSAVGVAVAERRAEGVRLELLDPRLLRGFFSSVDCPIASPWPVKACPVALTTSRDAARICREMRVEVDGERDCRCRRREGDHRRASRRVCSSRSIAEGVRVMRRPADGVTFVVAVPPAVESIVEPMPWNSIPAHDKIVPSVS